MLTPNDIPDKWKSAVSQAWDNALIRSQHETPEAGLVNYPNWALDQIMDGEGYVNRCLSFSTETHMLIFLSLIRTINVCMRWGPNETSTAEDRHHIVKVYEENYQSWLGPLLGYDNFPYAQVKFNVTGWAVSDAAQLQGSTDGFEVYTDFTDDDGLPTCDPGCSRHKHPDGNYSACDGGASNRFHQFFLLDPIGFGNMTMAAATGFGFFVGYDGWKNVGSKVPDWPLLLHETVGFLLHDFRQKRKAT